MSTHLFQISTTGLSWLRKFRLLALALFLTTSLLAQKGYQLWLNYEPLLRGQQMSYQAAIGTVYLNADSPAREVIRQELATGLGGMLSYSVPFAEKNAAACQLLIDVADAPVICEHMDAGQLAAIEEEGYLIFRKGMQLIITAQTEVGLLYGTFHFLQMVQRNESLAELNILSNPKIQKRVLNHWDNLDRTVERGYAGFSIWNWHELPEYIDQRYIDYARANASIGINGAVVTNVNANALIFREDYLEKAAALADVFRPYGIQLYLTARFSSPIEQGGLETADPLDSEVQEWWNEKVEEIYEYIPDFGGFLVKANSEGQPGPQEYNRTHADGANMLAKALAPHGGIVMWRAFVYSDEEPTDRAKQAYNEFVPLDGTFLPNVLVQVKNGPIDFQPREPIHPLFGAMPQTPLMMEFQITKEYLGQGTHLVGLANMYEEILQTDTYVKGEGSTVAKVIDGTLHGQQLTGIAGVANIGTAFNWTSNLFGQADWFAFGRLAWNPYTKAKDIFTDWSSLTWRQADAQAISQQLLSESYEACVKYMTPIGLHHIMAAGHHFGPGPWVSQMPRADWTSVYYHKADTEGIGFDRTASGSNALEQYAPGFRQKYIDPDDCPMDLLLWFHHVAWDKELRPGRTLWEELCFQYQEGVEKAEAFLTLWEQTKDKVDEGRFRQVKMHLEIQAKEAKWWRDACLLYFQTFSEMDFPEGYPKPQHDLKYYQSISHPYAPGIRPRW